LMQNKKLMNKLILSVILLAGFCAVFSACTKTDTSTEPAGPMTATFKKAGGPVLNFIGSHVFSAIQPNPDVTDTSKKVKDSTLSIVGYIYKPNTTQDSSLTISLQIKKYKAGMSGISVDIADTGGYAVMTDTSGYHFSSSGSINFKAATPYGATGTFTFQCSDNTSVTSGWFTANWRD
jgi:hypothetical protein